MPTPADILNIASQRAETLGLPYAGALTPRESFDLWQADKRVILVDVRTRAEWDWVGRIPGAVQIEWQTYPGGEPNPHFLSELERQVAPAAIVLFICRSGARSHNAASLATDAGYTHSYNILEGFEGNVDAAGQRGRSGGWRFAGLPWLS